MEGELPEVTLLHDARGERPPNAAGIGDFWYEPGVWSIPLSPAARVLYAGLCSFLGNGEINCKDLRNALKSDPMRRPWKNWFATTSSPRNRSPGMISRATRSIP